MSGDLASQHDSRRVTRFAHGQEAEKQRLAVGKLKNSFTINDPVTPVVFAYYFSVRSCRTTEDMDSMQYNTSDIDSATAYWY
jgi:hypothetical protein